MIRFLEQFIKNFTGDMAIDLIEAILIIAVLDIFSPLFSYIIVKLFNWKKKGEEIKENAFYTPIKSFFKILGIYIAILYLQPTFNISQKVIDIVTKVFRMIVIITTAIGLTNSITKKSRFIRAIKDRSDKEFDDATTNIIVRIIKVLIYIIAAFMVIADLGYDLSGIITGLGLGSVVVTLAAQDTMKNLFGGLMIFMDKPFVVGEYIRFGTYEGTVEDITFRSTKIRTLENSIAQIPNAEISSTAVVNFTKMEKRRYELNLGLVLSTDLNKMVNLKIQLLEFLNNHEHVIEDSTNVTFQAVEPSEFKMQIYCYVDTVDYSEYLNVKEQLNFGIMDIVHQNKIELAYETRTIEIKNFTK